MNLPTRHEIAMKFYENALLHNAELIIREGQTTEEAMKEYWEDVARYSFIFADAFMDEGKMK